MAEVILNDNSTYVDGGNESIIITRDVADIPGGVVLDVTGITETVLEAGRVIMQNTETKDYYPLGVTSGAYTTPAEGATVRYAGILKHTITTAKPLAAVLTIGQVNAAACPVPITDTIAAALPKIEFLYLGSGSGSSSSDES